MSIQKNKGFTLIELLVVIAIIGILAAIVLASLGSARSRGQAASVQSELANMRAQAEWYYGVNGNSYGTASACTAGMFATSSSSKGLAQLIAGVQSAGVTPACSSSASGWAVQTPLPTTGFYYCVDSTGYSHQRSTAFTVTNNYCQ